MLFLCFERSFLQFVKRSKALNLLVVIAQEKLLSPFVQWMEHFCSVEMLHVVLEVRAELSKNSFCTLLQPAKIA